MTESARRQIERDGYAILPRAVSEDVVDRVTAELATILTVGKHESESIRDRSGAVYAARNILELFPAAADVWQQPALLQLVREVLGPAAGLVRVLYFNKPPERTWTLPWHKDLSIAIRPPTGSVKKKYRVNEKAGVPHVEAPLEVLESMLTLRLHLDEVTPDNGPLKIVCGSHRTGKRLTLDDGPQKIICVNRGDVLAIRPLVSHSSPRSTEGTMRHRRILHFELSGMRQLPDGLEWHRFIPPVL